MVVTYCWTRIVWFAYVNSNYGTRPRHQAKHQYQPVPLQSEGLFCVKMLCHSLILCGEIKLCSTVSLYFSLQWFYFCSSHPKFIYFQFPSTNKSFTEVQNSMTDAAVGLNTAASDIITNSRTSSQQLSKSSEHYSRTYQHFVETGLTLAGKGLLD